MDSGVGGQIHGISLDSFLQMVQMERTSCTLTVKAGDRVGCMWFLKGELISAEAGEMKNIPAAHEILSWEDAVIGIENTCDRKDNEINRPLMNILMDGLKFRDEKRARGELTPQAPAAQPPQAPDLAEQPGPETEAPLELDTTDLQTPEAAPAPGPPEPQSPPMPSYEDEAPPLLPGLEAAEYEDFEGTGRPMIHPALQAGKRRKKKSSIVKLAAGVGIVIAILAVWLFLGPLGSDDVEDVYYRIGAQVEEADDLGAKKRLWQQFVADYPQGQFSELAANHLTEIERQIENQAFEDTVSKVRKLPVDDRFETEARAVYQNFLTAHPDSSHTQRVQELIQEIPARIDDAEFETARAASHSSIMDPNAKMEIYRQYLNRYPSGRHRDEVNRMLSTVGASYQEHLLTRKSFCDAVHKWTECIELADKLIANFKGTSLAEQISVLRMEMQDNQDLFDLKAEVRKLNADPDAARELYRQYMQRHPDSALKAVIEKELEDIDRLALKRSEWLRVSTYAANDKHNHARRIEHLQDYLRKNPSGAYHDEADALLKRLENEKVQAATGRRQDLNQNSTHEQQARQRRRETEAKRLEQEQQETRQRLQKAAMRFKDNGDGTVTDRKTGLIWTMLDSSQELNRCLNHAQSRAWAAGLRTGGYNDWRLPRSGELGALYKSKPFFPIGKTPWYWTSETHLKGFHEIAEVVTTRQETVFRNKVFDRDKCGSARAVRP